MTAPELLARLTAAGLSVTPDAPQPGGLLITPPGVITDELKGLVREHKKALLAHLRAAKDVAALGERLAGPGPEPFAFGANNPDDPDGEAAGLLECLREGGHAVSIDPADRCKLSITPRVFADALRVSVVRLKAALLALLEAEARQEELADKPTPFREAGVGEAGVVQGGAGGVADGLAGPPDQSPDGGDAPRGEDQAGHAPGVAGEGGARRGTEGGRGEGPGGPAEPLRLYVGWVRLKAEPEGFDVWRAVASAGDRWGCWAATLAHPAEPSCDRTVLEEGKSPGR